MCSACTAGRKSSTRLSSKVAADDGGMWTKEEDEKLKQLVTSIGPKNWSSIAKHFSGRIGKQCRERWHNHLNPDIKKDKWTEDEDRTLIHAQKQ